METRGKRMVTCAELLAGFHAADKWLVVPCLFLAWLDFCTTESAFSLNWTVVKRKSFGILY